MVAFINPFSLLQPDRKLTDRELIRAIRLSLSAEEEATSLYESLADATDNPLAKAVLLDIAREERVHKGEFQRLINLLSDGEEGFLTEGAEEVDEINSKLRKV